MPVAGAKEILARSKSTKARSSAAAEPKQKYARATKGGKGKGAAAKTDGERQASNAQETMTLQRSLQKATGLLTLNLAGRMRAIESIVVTTFLVKSDADFLDAMNDVSKEHHRAIMANKEKEGEERYNPEAPIHVLCWAAAVAVWIEEVDGAHGGGPKGDLEAYVTEMEADYTEVANDVLYFRKIVCYKPECTKLLVAFTHPSTAGTIFKKVIQPHVKTLYESKPLRGMAPKSGNERKLERNMKSAGLIVEGGRKKGAKEMSDEDF